MDSLSSGGCKSWILTVKMVCLYERVHLYRTTYVTYVSVSVFQHGEGSSWRRRQPKCRRRLQQRLRHVTGERHPLTGRWRRRTLCKCACICCPCICVCTILHIWILSAEPDIMRYYNLHKDLHICTCFISSVLFILYVVWQVVYV